MVTRLDHHKAKIPPPTPSLFESMGQVAYQEYATLNLNFSGDRSKRVRLWDELTPVQRECWIGMSRSLWKWLAIRGGAVEKKTQGERS